MGSLIIYILLAANPFGGLVVAIPLAVLKFGYPIWFVLLTGPPLAYTQVMLVDALWSLLERWPWWRRFMERKRTPRVERLLAGRGAFLPTFLTAPLVGPWLVMAFMRYLRVPQRRVALPILLSMVMVASVCALVCYVAPAYFSAPTLASP